MTRLLFAAMMLVMAGGAPAKQVAPVSAPQAAAARIGHGYLKTASLPDSLALLPPPPADGSAAEARDLEASRAALAVRGSPRWDLAMADAELFGPQATSALSCAAGIAIGPETTPKLDRMLRRVMPDLGLATYGAKLRYQRKRPFVVNLEANCTPALQAQLAKDGSYPSGHSAIGWGWGLILAELLPERTSQLVARGGEFGDSRRICNVHWLSDVEAGRTVASATVARLHGDPVFRRDLEAVRKEVQRIKAVPADCDKEAATLAATTP
jgi:acid phosphatase (class A)